MNEFSVVYCVGCGKPTTNFGFPWQNYCSFCVQKSNAEERQDIKEGESMALEGFEEVRDEVVNASEVSVEEFWKRAEERDFLTVDDCETKKVKAVRLKEFKGIRKINGEKLGVVFLVEILTGEWKGKTKTLTIYDNKALKLKEEFGTKDFSKWIGQILSIAVDGQGKFRKMNFTKYEKVE